MTNLRLASGKLYSKFEIRYNYIIFDYFRLKMSQYCEGI